MRKLRFFGISFLVCLILSNSAVIAQGQIGVVGLMSGKVSRSDGRGFGGAFVSATPSGTCFLWEGSMTRTNPFGYYRMYVHYDCILLVSATRKGMTFSPASLFIPIDGHYENIDFIAN